MASKNPTSVASIMEKLTSSKSFSGGPIMLGDKQIGSFVTYGKVAPNGNRKTVFGSRIYSPVKIEVEAATRASLLKKVASEL